MLSLGFRNGDIRSCRLRTRFVGTRLLLRATVMTLLSRNRLGSVDVSPESAPNRLTYRLESLPLAHVRMALGHFIVEIHCGRVLLLVLDDVGEVRLEAMVL